MIQSAGDPGFLLKATQPVGIGRKRSWKDFNGDVSAQSGIPSPIYFAHTACANLRDYFIWPYLRPGRHAHGGRL